MYRRVQILPKSAEVLSCSGHGLAEEAHDNAASVGIAVAHGTETPSDLLRDADTAMYRAKEGGRDRAVMFGAHLRAQAVRRHSVEQELRSALDEDRIEVHFQPVIRLSDSQVVGAEALARIRRARARPGLGQRCILN